MTPAVSVILPTYNRGRMLGAAVDSVRAQSFSDWEMVIVDDGSTDGSIETLPKDPRICVITIAHSGSPAIARNAGLTVARGEWVALIDSDDLWQSDKLTRQLDALRGAPDARWSCTGFSFIDGDGQPVPQRAGRAYAPISGWILESLVSGGPAIVSISTVMLHRSLIREIGEFDTSRIPREDVDYVIRAAKRSPIVAVGSALTIIREHADRLTHRSSSAELLDVNARVFEKAAQDDQTPGIRAHCLRRAALQRATQARILLRDGARRDAIRAAWRGCRTAPTSAPPWRALAKCLLYP